MLIRIPDTALCNDQLLVSSCFGGLDLRPLVCILPKGHKGNHDNGSAVWRNVQDHNQKLEQRAISQDHDPSTG